MTSTDAYADWPPATQDNGKAWSSAKLTILRLLWPMEWVEGTKIYEAVEQTYYDRRIRELRESGWQIETHPSGGKYRLISHVKRPGSVRKYPTARQKRELRLRDKGRCQICGAADTRLQDDHKILLDRNGQTELDNLQLLCSACNVLKRGVCKRCTVETCDECAYAYPELYGSRVIVVLDQDTAERLRRESERRGVTDADLAGQIIRRYWDASSDG